MNRRQAVATAGVAVAATLAGLGWALRKPTATQHDLWSARFPTPEGGTLALADLRGQPLLLNFWATWCAPCVREMPVLDAFQREYGARGWRVVGIAIDQAGPVREFLQRAPVSFAIALAGVPGIELARRLGNEGGALPFSAVFDAGGRLVAVHRGETSAAQLEGWARRHG